MRLRRSGTRNTLANFSSIKPQLPVISSELSVSSSKPRCGNWLMTTDNLNLAAGLFDLFLGRLGKLVRVYRDRLGQLALTEPLHQRILGTHHSGFAQQFGRDLALAQAGQPCQVHYFILDSEDVGEAALGQAAMQRHLPTLEAAHHARTTA